MTSNHLAEDQGDSERDDAAHRLLTLLYEELCKLAASKLAKEKPGQTLDATALVHEAYVRLVNGENGQCWNGPAHFFGAAAEAMRRILVDQARRKGRQKNGGNMHRVELSDFATCDDPDTKVLSLDEAIMQLAAEDPIAAEVVKLKYFAGLNREQIAKEMGLSLHETRQKWDYARAWLKIALRD